MALCPGTLDTRVPDAIIDCNNHHRDSITQSSDQFQPDICKDFGLRRSLLSLQFLFIVFVCRVSYSLCCVSPFSEIIRRVHASHWSRWLN